VPTRSCSLLTATRDPVHARAAQPVADLAASVCDFTVHARRTSAGLAFEDTLLRLPPGFSASITGNAKRRQARRRPVEGDSPDALSVGLAACAMARVLRVDPEVSSGW